MDSKTLREKYLKFFERNGHKIILSASLVPSEEEQLAGKERVLFTSAGMQPLIPYLTGQKEPPSRRLVDVQKCLRTDDIEEVGDLVHHTFFEMLGNWSIGDYWKDEAIKLSFEFLTKELNIPIEKLAVSVFAGDEDAPKDEESAKVWESLGIPKERIFYFGKTHNWWPTARKEQDSGEYKNPFGPCGPDTEMFYWTGEGQPEGRPNEDVRWVEIWNDVFMQFNRKEDGSLEDLPQKNVDTGMGLERTLAVLTGKQSAYETDLFMPIIDKIEESKNNYSEKSKRIIADHLRAAVFLIAEHIKPNSKDKHGSVVFRLIRDSIKTQEGFLEKGILEKIINKFIEIYKNTYKILEDNKGEILSEIIEAEKAVRKGGESPERINRLEKQIEEITKLSSPNLKIVVSDLISVADRVGVGLNDQKSLSSLASGSVAFDYHQNWGTTEGTALTIARRLAPDAVLVEKGYEEALKKHQELSRGYIQKSLTYTIKPAEKGIFKGGLAEINETTTKYHTTTHLLHQALRDVLGPEVFQKGSNITAERLRFDFSFDRKMTDEEIKKAEDIVNQKIKEDLKVDHKVVSLEQAKKMNAIGLFNEKYGKDVSIYGVGPDYELDPKAKDQRDRAGYYSLEFCGGPHVEHTGVIGKIKITKEEAVSAGIRRIRAQLA